MGQCRKSSGVREKIPYGEYQEYEGLLKDRYTEDITLSDTLKEKLDAVYDGAEYSYERLKRLEVELGICAGISP